jgi:malonate-semialdehyde dehydrogenase (acetylating)/methylmalonate-semialdehyde dehydrogenase
VEDRPAIACGNAFILKPSERDPGVPMRIAELFIEAGLPAASSTSSTATRKWSTPSSTIRTSRPSASSARPRSRSTSIPRGGERQARPVLRRRQEPHDHHARRRHGPGGRCADRRRLRLGRRALHGDLGRRAGRRGDRRPLIAKLIPRVESLKVGPSTDRSADFGPLVTKQALDRVKGYVDIGVKEGAKLVVDGRGFKMQGYENGYYMGGCLFDNVTPDMRSTRKRSSARCCRSSAPRPTKTRCAANDHEYGNGVAIFTRDGDAARDFASRVQVGMVGVNVPIPVPIAYYTFGGWKARPSAT